MAGKSKRPRLVLTSEEQKQIRQLRESQTEPWREVQRARILWRYHSGQSVAEIARAVKLTRKSVAKWIAKALAMGVCACLKRYLPSALGAGHYRGSQGLCGPFGLLESERT